MTDARREEQLRIQAVGAAISRRDWHAVEQAYNAIRDEFDRRPNGAGSALDREWLKTEISAIDTWYRGDPSYMHDACWMKDRVLKLLDHPAALSSPATPEPAKPQFLAIEDGEFNGNCHEDQAEAWPSQTGGLNADWIAMVLAEHASIEDGKLANGSYLAVKIADAADLPHEVVRLRKALANIRDYTRETGTATMAIGALSPATPEPVSAPAGEVVALLKAVAATIAFYDGLPHPHADGEARILDELQAAYRAALSNPAPGHGEGGL